MMLKHNKSSHITTFLVVILSCISAGASAFWMNHLRGSPQYTPSAEFLVSSSKGEVQIYLPNRQDSFTFLKGDDDSGCNAAVCKGKHITSSIAGRQTDAGFTFSMASTEWGNLEVSCPFGAMTPSVSDAYCPQTSNVSRLANVTYNVDGPHMNNFRDISLDCPTSGYYRGTYLVLDVECTAEKTEELTEMKALSTAGARQENSFGAAEKWDRHNIMIQHEGKDEGGIVFVDGMSTFLEFLSGDTDAYCSTTACQGSHYTAFVYGPELNNATLYSNDEFSGIRVMCPYGDQTPTVTIIECEGESGDEVSILSEGPIIFDWDLECDAEVVGIEVVCVDS